MLLNLSAVLVRLVLWTASRLCRHAVPFRPRISLRLTLTARRHSEREQVQWQLRQQSPMHGIYFGSSNAHHIAIIGLSYIQHQFATFTP